MLTQFIIGMTRRRWQAERPFEGHIKESLQRKLKNPAVRVTDREQVHQKIDASRAGPDLHVARPDTRCSSASVSAFETKT